MSLKTDAVQRYLVSDGGRHTVQSELRFHAEPAYFVRLLNSIGPITRLGSQMDGLVAVKSTSLWAETNVDIDPNRIRYSLLDNSRQNPFRLLSADGRLQLVDTFTQSVSFNFFMWTMFNPQTLVNCSKSRFHEAFC